ncbi:hypothetical protein HDV05_003031 [Chytridiales sp. JEL 0842]|nr:hypothetical protein HDV05_003031 [Chytridiales sp. JEL 0842]
MDQIVAVIYAFNGDVIKFLGDAILVCFSPFEDEEESEVAERAAYCCLYISTQFSSLSVDLTKARQDYGANGGESALYRSGTSKYSSLSANEDTKDDAMKIEKSTLRIHVAATASEVEHVIVGLSDKRLDYIIHGPCMKDLGVMLDNTKEGELGISSALLQKCPNSFRGAVKHLSASASKGAGGYVLKSMEDMKLVLGLLSEARPALVERIAKPSSDDDDSLLEEDSFELHPFSIGAEEGENEALEKERQDKNRLVKLFINESLLHKLEAQSAINGRAQTINSKTNIAKRRMSAVSAHSASSEYSSGNGTSSKATDPFLKREFRVISIMFIKLSAEFIPSRAQTAMEAFVQILRNYEGVFQQYSVDDKGQTMLACFGLPPYTHEKDSLYALKAAVEFNAFVAKTPDVGKVSIGVCTGEIFVSKLGNRFRADTSLLGDAVNVAARLLSVGGNSKASVVKCDAATYKLTKEDFHHVSLGAQKIKGKAEAIDVYSVSAKDDTTKTIKPVSEQPDTAVCGYKQEREILDKALQNWDSGEENQRVVVIGKSGYGKSKLLDEIASKVLKSGYTYCLTQGSQLKENSPFNALQNLATFIFNFSLQSETDEVATNSGLSRRVSTISTEQKHLRRIPSKSSVAASRRSVVYASRSELLNFAQDGHERSQNHQKARDFLTQMGESPELAPLLSDVLPYVNIADNAHTKTMDGPTRRTMLKSLMIRLVKKSLTDMKYVIIFDDTQWFDEVSLSVINDLIYKCPNTLIYIFMRPLGESPLPVFSSIYEAPNLIKLELNGFSEADVEEVLVTKLSGFGVSKVQSRTLTALFHKCGGSPLVIDTLAESFRSQFDDLFEVDSSGAMQFSNEEAEGRLDGPSNLDSLVLTQFDKLNPQFQSILRIASILGQQFDLEDLTYFLEEEMEEYMDVYQLETIIQEQDIYHFLVKQDVNDEERHAYSFRHVQIIYESQPYGERVHRHLVVAEYFESLLTSSNRETLLPTISYHYSRTESDKKIMYLEEIGLHLFSQSHMRECVTSLSSLLAVVNTYPSMEIDSVRKAGWMSCLAFAKVQVLIMTKEELNLCMQALNLLGRPWPSTPKDVKKATLRSAIELYKLWKRTEGGTKTLKPRSVSFGFTSKKAMSESEAAKLKKADDIALSIYHTLFRLGTYVTIFPKSDLGLLFFKKINTIICHGHQEKVKFVYAMSIISLGVSTSIPFFAKLLYGQAEKVESSMSDAEKEASGVSHLTKSMVALSYAQLRKAVEAANSYLRYTESRGDNNMASAGYAMLQLTLPQLGDLHTQDSNFRKVSTSKTAMYKHALIKSNMLRGLLTTDYADTLERIKIYEELPRPPYYLNEMNTTITQCWVALQEEDYAVALEKLEHFSRPEFELRQFHIGAYDTFLYIPPLLCLLTFPCAPKKSGAVYRWTESEWKRAGKCFEQLGKNLEGLAIKKQLDVFYWPYLVFKACKFLVEGRRKKGLKVLAAPKKREILEEMVLLRACMDSLFALFGEDQQEKRRRFEKAIEVFKKGGFSYMEAWLNCAMLSVP